MSVPKTATVPPAKPSTPYSAEISRATPTCFLFDAVKEKGFQEALLRGELQWVEDD